MDDNVQMNTPINSVQLGGTMPLCKHTVPWPTPAATWTAGETVKIQFGAHAASHSGGHAEFSISYDGGHTFVVIEQVLRFVFVGSKPASVTNEVSVFDYEVTLPANLPASDKAIFAWTWVNASGNREFYMNCADVAIKGTSESITGKNVTIANYPGYPTIAEFDGNYDTGIQYYTTDVTYVTVYGNGKSEVAKSGSSKVKYKSQSGAATNVVFNLVDLASATAQDVDKSSSTADIDIGAIATHLFHIGVPIFDFPNFGKSSSSADVETDNIESQRFHLGIPIFDNPSYDNASSDDYGESEESLEWCDDESDDESWEWCDEESAYAEPVIPTNEPELMCDASYESELYSSNCDVFYSGIYVENTFLGSDNDLNPLVIESLGSDYHHMVTITSYETSTLDENSESDGLGGLDSEPSSAYHVSSETSSTSHSSTDNNGYAQFEYSSTSSSA
ncbi:hypothetical protein GGI23_005179 [Coemansia sp. RSA 2559]|nr:hypothetical protein GGI23_005179 [Coemansia sp. RSA 2559]KAJ2862664.1 hypothetical protein GGI22_002133 [Coemansia erecta]